MSPSESPAVPMRIGWPARAHKGVVVLGVLFLATPVLAQTGGATTSSGTATTGAEKDQEKEKGKAATDDQSKDKGTASDQKDKTTGGSASPGTKDAPAASGSGTTGGTEKK